MYRETCAVARWLGPAWASLLRPGGSLSAARNPPHDADHDAEDFDVVGPRVALQRLVPAARALGAELERRGVHAPHPPEYHFFAPPCGHDVPVHDRHAALRVELLPKRHDPSIEESGSVHCVVTDPHAEGGHLAEDPPQALVVDPLRLWRRLPTELRRRARRPENVGFVEGSAFAPQKNRAFEPWVDLHPGFRGKAMKVAIDCALAGASELFSELRAGRGYASDSHEIPNDFKHLALSHRERYAARLHLPLVCHGWRAREHSARWPHRVLRPGYAVGIVHGSQLVVSGFPPIKDDRPAFTGSHAELLDVGLWGFGPPNRPRSKTLPG